MRGSALALALSLLCLSPAALAASDVAPAAAVTANLAARERSALALAELLYPVDQQVGAVDQVLVGMRGVMLTNPEMAALEASRPGVVQAIVDAMAPVLRASAVDMTPRYQQRIAQIYAAEMDERELAEAVDFFRGPALVTIRKFQKGQSYQQSMTTSFNNPEDALDAKTVSQDQKHSVANFLLAIDESDLPNIAKFETFDWSAKWAGLSGPIAQLDAELANSPDPALEAALLAAMANAIETFAPKAP